MVDISNLLLAVQHVEGGDYENFVISLVMCRLF